MPGRTVDAAASVRAYFLKLQDRICSAFEGEESGSRFHRDAWDRGAAELYEDFLKLKEWACP